MGHEVLTARGKVRRVIVVGGGVTGLSTAVRLCERGVPVLLVTSTPPRRSHSVCNSSGIFAGARPGGNEDSVLGQHVQDTVAAGHHRAHVAPVVALVKAAPGIVRALSRMGVPFDRTGEGHLDLQGALGATGSHTAYAGTRTGQHILYALEEQLRRYGEMELQDAVGHVVPGERRLRVLEGWEFLSLVLDDNGVAVGIVAQDAYTMAIKALPADAVCVATGGYAALFNNSTASRTCFGTATASLFDQGAILADTELLGFSPLAAPAPGSLRQLGERLLIEGARIWTPRDAADTRAPERIPKEERQYAMDGGTAEETAAPYLDVSMIPMARRVLLLERLPSGLRAHGVETACVRLASAVEVSLGGLWVDHEVDAAGRLVPDSARNHSTSISGAFAAGDAAAQYHGAGLLGCNRVLSHLFGGQGAARGMEVYVQSLARSAFDLPGSLFDRAEHREVSRYEGVLKGADAGTENVRQLEEELTQTMTRHCSSNGHNSHSAQSTGNVTRESTTRAGQALEDLIRRSAQLHITDRGSRLNQTVPAVFRLRRALILARVITRSLAQRLEAPSPTRRTLVRQGSDGEPVFVRSFEYESLGSPVNVTDAIARVSPLAAQPQPAAPATGGAP